MNTQTILTIVYLFWLFLVLALLYKIWREGATRMQRMQTTLIGVAIKASDSAQIAAEAARTLAAAERTVVNDAIPKESQ